jgi:hypothetical protein
MLDQALGDDRRHDLIRVMDALAALRAQREGERGVSVGIKLSHPPRTAATSTLRSGSAAAASTLFAASAAGAIGT